MKDHEKKTVIENVLHFSVYRNHSLYGKGEVNCPHVYLLVSILIITITIVFILHLFFSFI